MTWPGRAGSPAPVLEEALELGQAEGLSRADAELMVNYVYSRPVGESGQEVGGVMVTLAALCWNANIDLGSAAGGELLRIEAPEVMEKIRLKQAAKTAIDGITSDRFGVAVKDTPQMSLFSFLTAKAD